VTSDQWPVVSKSMCVLGNLLSTDHWALTTSLPTHDYKTKRPSAQRGGPPVRQ